VKNTRLLSQSEKAVLEKISAGAAALPGVSRIVFFGSRNRGDFSKDSDLDILIILKDISHKDNAIRFLHDLELAYDVPLAPVIYTEHEYEINKRMKSGFVLNIEKEGTVLYDALS